MERQYYGTHNNGNYLIYWNNNPGLIFDLSPSNTVMSKLSTEASDQIKDDDIHFQINLKLWVQKL